MKTKTPIPTRIVPSAVPAEQSPGRVEREFRAALDDGAVLRPVGRARRRPSMLLARGYTPKYKVELFDAIVYLTNIRQNPDIRFFVAYVVPDRNARGRRVFHPRIFYKDVSLVWRSATHFVRSDQENWIGKGEVREYVENGRTMVHSAEETTDLPLELQTALETLSRKVRSVRRDDVALGLVLRQGPDDRIEPYRDFSEPRRRARSDPSNLVNGGRSIARFTRKNDPTSLRFVPGFEPDFERGVLELETSKSKLYGGILERYRIVSRNRKVQYLFFAGPRHVWIIPPQATTTELMSYGVRTIDVIADEDLCVPGYEYHFVDDFEDPPELVTQIPPGFAGAPSPVDAERADASRWLDQLPVVVEFRKRVLGRRRSQRRKLAADAAAHAFG